MTQRETVLEQIRHRETPRIPYTLPYSKEVGTRLDEYYGGDDWRNRIIQYFTSYGVIGESAREEVDATHFRDVFGTV